jgi:hypothetical protein
MNIATSLSPVIILFDETFECGDGATNAEHLCVDRCNFVQCHIFVNYLIC